MVKKISRPDAATGTTTERAYNPISKAERIKQIAENYFNEMNSLKQNIEENVRTMAEFCFKFGSDVNEITDKEKGFTQITATPNYIVKNYVTGLFEMIMNSGLSVDEQLEMLDRLDGLVICAKYGGYLEAYSENEENWDELVRVNADQLIVKHTGRRGRNKK